MVHTRVKAVGRTCDFWNRRLIACSGSAHRPAAQHVMGWGSTDKGVLKSDRKKCYAVRSRAAVHKRASVVIAKGSASDKSSSSLQARDAFYKCVDDLGEAFEVGSSPEPCKALRKEYERCCAASWVCSASLPISRCTRSPSIADGCTNVSITRRASAE